MADTNHDGNHTPTLIGVLDSDGQTIINVLANASNHGLEVNDDITGSDNGPANSLHDANHVAVLMATSSTDGITPVVIYADTNGRLLIDSA